MAKGKPDYDNRCVGMMFTDELNNIRLVNIQVLAKELFTEDGIKLAVDLESAETITREQLTRQGVDHRFWHFVGGLAASDDALQRGRIMWVEQSPEEDVAGKTQGPAVNVLVASEF